MDSGLLQVLRPSDERHPSLGPSLDVSLPPPRERRTGQRLRLQHPGHRPHLCTVLYQGGSRDLPLILPTLLLLMAMAIKVMVVLAIAAAVVIPQTALQVITNACHSRYQHRRRRSVMNKPRPIYKRHLNLKHRLSLFLLAPMFFRNVPFEF